MAMIIVDHKLSYLLKIVDRVLVMHFGKLIAQRPPEEIVKHPQVLEAYLGREGA